MTNFKLQKLVYLLEYQITGVTIVDKKQESLFSCKKKKKSYYLKYRIFGVMGRNLLPKSKKEKKIKMPAVSVRRNKETSWVAR